MSNWIEIANISDIPSGSGKEFTVGARIVALFNVDGQFHAVDGICAHAGGPIGEGELTGCIVTCPWHGWQYDVSTGGMCLNDQIRLESFPVKVEGNFCVGGDFVSEPSGKSIATPPATVLERVLFWFSIGLGLGTVRTAPGTVGSLWGPLLVLGFQTINPHPGMMFLYGVILFVIGVPVCAAGIRYYQSGDPKHVVFDEIAAFPFVFLFVPVTWGTAVAGFVLFRIFDISKLWPINRFEKLPGPWGVMADDFVAGLFAGLVLTGLWAMLGPF